MGGVPCIRNLRIPVATVINMLAEGLTEKEILELYPDLESEDIKEALRFAAELLWEKTQSLETFTKSNMFKARPRENRGSSQRKRG